MCIVSLGDVSEEGEKSLPSHVCVELQVCWPAPEHPLSATGTTVRAGSPSNEHPALGSLPAVSQTYPQVHCACMVPSQLPRRKVSANLVHVKL